MKDYLLKLSFIIFVGEWFLASLRLTRAAMISTLITSLKLTVAVMLLALSTAQLTSIVYQVLSSH